ncbi:MAG: matrixin family metalloprotease [Euryarchaeota archaeon]|nr:matrixin family metalloprotease [Euryarchaeota archaeon]
MIFVRAWLLVGMFFAATSTAPIVFADPGGSRGVDQRVYDDEGRLIWEFGKESDALRFARHYNHRPGHGGSGTPLTDCTSTAYKVAAWRWTSAFTATASAHASLFDQAASTWDAATAATISGGITEGSAGVAGVQDFVNQIDFVDLGATTTIAVTTTWYYVSTGEAVESDGQYNLHYAWGTDGSGGVMDVLNIATHEVGHSFGLDHPKGPPAKLSCLSMYAYGSLGETQKRTLGDGDILGIRAIYGA